MIKTSTMLLMLLLLECKALRVNQNSGVMGAEESYEEDELILVCKTADGPQLEIEVFRTGFDLREGAKLDVVIHELGSADEQVGQTFDAQGAIGQKALQIYFEKGEIIASRAQDGELDEQNHDVRSRPPPRSTVVDGSQDLEPYRGSLAMGPADRQVSCQ
jgi:hypothetical protein